jgi:hypothetical protein
MRQEYDEEWQAGKYLERGTRDLSQHTLLQTDKNNSQFK